MEEEMGYSWSALLVWLRSEGFSPQEVHLAMTEFGHRELGPRPVQLELPLRGRIPEDIY